jgi:hypothetical protein
MGWPVYLLALAGIGWALVRPGVREAVLLAFPIPYFLVIGAWSSRFERYALPLLPALALFAAAALIAGAHGAAARSWLPRRALAAAVALAVAALVLPEVARAVAYHRLLAQPDTRVLGAAWVEREVPPGTRIALEPYTLSLPVARQQLEAEAGQLAATLQHPLPPDAAVGRPGAGGADGYWLVRLATYDLDRLRRDGVRYVVLSGFVYQRHREACDAYPRACRFYAALEAQGAPVFSVSPGGEERRLWVGDIYSPLTDLRDRRHPGPSIRIYRLPDGATG